MVLWEEGERGMLFEVLKCVSEGEESVGEEVLLSVEGDQENVFSGNSKGMKNIMREI